MSLDRLLPSLDSRLLQKLNINSYSDFDLGDDIYLYEAYYLGNGIYLTFLNEERFSKVMEKYFEFFDYYLFKHIKIGESSFMIFKNNMGDYVFVSYELSDIFRITLEGIMDIYIDAKNILFSINYFLNNDIGYMNLLPGIYLSDSDLFVVRDIYFLLKNILNNSEQNRYII